MSIADLEKLKNSADTTIAIWEVLYLTRIPKLQTTSITNLRAVGTYISGDRSVDNTLSEQWLTTYICISDMVSYYRDGVQIKIVKEIDTKAIYEAISEHLEAWLLNLRYAINIGNAPVQDLIDMDNFANDIYSFAKYHFTRDALSSVIGKKMTEGLTFTPNTFFKQNPNNPIQLIPSINEECGSVTRIRPIEDDFPERESLTEHLKNHLQVQNRW
jgi:hypothetical protein